MYRAGIDVGGTFTDVILIEEGSGQTFVAKVLNEHGRRAQTVVRGVQRVIEIAGISPDDIRIIGHGTTITTNAVLERKGAPTALVTNAGFRDVIEIGRFSRPADLIYRVQLDKPKPLVPRRHRFEIDCRVDKSGMVLREPDDRDIDALVETIRQSGVRTVAVCLLFSFIAPEHEQKIAERLKSALPDVDVLISSEVQPEFREFPRTSTTIFSAYVSPVLREYVEALIVELDAAGLAAPLFIFQSNGGLARPDIVLRNPATTLLSGPAGAVAGAAHLSQACGYSHLITMDMGGTSLDICLLNDGVAEATTSREIEFYPIVTPMLDVHTVGAGGGSLVRLDEVGRLKVGPESASSFPGPACYGLGNEEVTLTDVNLVLGYLDPDNFAAGEVKLYRDKAEQAIIRHIAEPLKISLHQAALGIFSVAANQMAEAIRFVSIRRGYDPRDFDLMTLGGGGPIHGFAIAEELGTRRIIVPRNPGLFSASGIAVADFTHSYLSSVLKPVSALRSDDIAALSRNLLTRAEADLQTEGVEVDKRRYERSLDMRYVGQATEISIRPADDNWQKNIDLEAFAAEFHRQHKSLYSYAVEDEPVEVVNIRVKAIGLVKKPKLVAGQSSGRRGKPVARRDVWFAAHQEPKSSDVYLRDDLDIGAVIAGPAIIQELSSATVIPPGASAVIDAFENILLTLPSDRLRSKEVR